MSFEARNVYWLWLSAIVVVLDQITKQLVVREFEQYDSMVLTSWLNLVHRQNTGAAFSMFSDASPLVFVALGIVVTIGIMIWMRRHPRGEELVAVALSLILGGALGNVIDRVTRGHVVDFVDFHLGGWHFPAFNVADSAITLGAACLILDMLLDARRQKLAPRSEDA